MGVSGPRVDPIPETRKRARPEPASGLRRRVDARGTGHSPVVPSDRLVGLRLGPARGSERWLGRRSCVSGPVPGEWWGSMRIATCDSSRAERGYGTPARSVKRASRRARDRGRQPALLERAPARAGAAPRRPPGSGAPAGRRAPAPARARPRTRQTPLSRGPAAARRAPRARTSRCPPPRRELDERSRAALLRRLHAAPPAAPRASAQPGLRREPPRRARPARCPRRQAAPRGPPALAGRERRAQRVDEGLAAMREARAHHALDLARARAASGASAQRLDAQEGRGHLRHRQEALRAQVERALDARRQAVQHA